MFVQDTGALLYIPLPHQKARFHAHGYIKNSLLRSRIASQSSRIWNKLKNQLHYIIFKVKHIQEVHKVVQKYRQKYI